MGEGKKKGAGKDARKSGRARTRSDESSGEEVPTSPMSMEQAMAEVTRLLQSQQFETKEDATAFIASQISGKRIEELKMEASERPIARAQELIYAAEESDSRSERIALAEEALEISPDCADAYRILAEMKSRSTAEARRYLVNAVAAGERALGPELFEEAEGHFWGHIETRPYMRARAALAACLWYMGQEEEAIRHYQDMLRLNPDDNQGVRQELISMFLSRGDQAQAGELLDRYAEDGSAIWLYSRALWLFRGEGESDDASAALADAVEFNPHVPPYLLGDRKLPARGPQFVGFGDEREAQAYAMADIELWTRTPGARGWLLRKAGTKGGRRRR